MAIVKFNDKAFIDPDSIEAVQRSGNKKSELKIFLASGEELACSIDRDLKVGDFLIAKGITGFIVCDDNICANSNAIKALLETPGSAASAQLIFSSGRMLNCELNPTSNKFPDLAKKIQDAQQGQGSSVPFTKRV